MPFRIRLFDEGYLPRSVPVLDPLFPLYGFVDVVMDFEVNQVMNLVAFRESFDEATPMFPNSSDEIARNPCVQGTVAPAGQDVNGGLFRHRGAFRGFPLPTPRFRGAWPRGNDVGSHAGKKRVALA